jgi:hypothetical protein
MDTIIKAIDTLSEVETPSKSVVEAISNLEGLVISDGAAAVAAALEPEGDITTAIGTAITTELGEEGAIKTAIEAAIPQAAHQADSEATEAGDLVLEFNALLAKLKASGLMADG